MGRKDFVVNTVLLKKELGRRRMSMWRLAKLTAIPYNTLRDYINQRRKMPDYSCAIVCDALGLPVSSLFPQIRTVAPGFVDLKPIMREAATGTGRLSYELAGSGRAVDAGGIPDGEVEEYERGRSLTVNDMIAGSATLLPCDMLVKVRAVTGMSEKKAESIRLGRGCHAVVHTGILAGSVDLGRTLFHAAPKFLLRMFVHPFGVSCGEELCILVVGIDDELQVAHGQEVAKMILFR